MASSFDQEYKVVIALKDVISEKSLKNDLECKISLGDYQIINKIPLKEAITLDVKDLQKYGFCDIQFDHKARILGKIRIPIPPQIEAKNEIEIEENFCIKTENDDKKTVEIKGKYLLVILNKRFFNKKKATETPSQNPKNLIQSECLPEKKQASNEKKKQTIKQNISASPSTAKSQKKESNNAKYEEITLQSLTNPEKLESTEVLKPNDIKYEILINKNEVLKSESEKFETSEPFRKLETKQKSEEIEYIVYSPKTLKTTSNINTLSNENKKKNQPAKPQSQKKKKNAELLDSLIDKACENQELEKKFIDDMDKIDECVYLTRLKNLEENKEKQEPENGDSAKIKKIFESSYENKEYREQFDISPESLAKKYDRIEEKTISNNNSVSGSTKTKEKKRFYSPNTNFKNNSIALDTMESSAVLLDNEVGRNMKNYENQIKYLKIMVYALDKKLADYNSVKKESELLKLELKKNEHSRKDLQETIKETTNEMKNEIAQLHTNYNQIINEKNDYIDKLKTHENKAFELNDLNEKLENSKRKLEEDFTENNVKLKGFNEIKAQSEMSKIQVINGEKKQSEIQNNFANKLKEINQILQSLEKQNKDLSHEKNEVKREINDLKNALNSQSNLLLEKNSEIETMKRKLQINQGYDLLIKNLNEQISNLTKQLEEKKLELDGAFHYLENVKSELITTQKTVSTREKKINDQNHLLEKQSLQQDIKINHLNDQIFLLQSKNSEIKTSLSSLEQLVCIKEDLRKQLDFSNEKVDNLTKDKVNLLNKINELFDQITHQGHNLFDANSIINQLKDFLAQKENYCNNLKKLILEMREKGGYVPFKDDPIDNKLADYINSMNFSDTNLKILFIREGEGVYQFGTKRVYVTIHQDRINIRVGGGFMKIEDFVESYTPLELDKLKRKDPVKIFNTNLAVNKTIAGRMVHEFEKMRTAELKPEKFNNVFRMIKKNE